MRRLHGRPMPGRRLPQLSPWTYVSMAAVVVERSVRRHRQGCRPAVLKFADTSSANVRQGSPAFILKLTAGLNSSRSFASVRQCSPALLSPLLSKCRLYKFTAAVRSSAMPPSSAVDHRLRRVEDFHNSYSFRLVKFRRHLVEETGPQNRGGLPGGRELVSCRRAAHQVSAHE